MIRPKFIMKMGQISLSNICISYRVTACISWNPSCMGGKSGHREIDGPANNRESNP